MALPIIARPLPDSPVQKPVLISYIVLVLTLVLVGCLHLATPFIVVMFACFLLRKLAFFRKKWIAVVCFLVLAAAIFCGFTLFLKNQASIILPKIVATAIPLVVDFADKHGIGLPFEDLPSLKDFALDSVKETLGYLGNFAKIGKEFALLVMAVAVGIGVFINPKLDQESDPHSRKTNLYSVYCALISERFAAFYRSFERVMGAQLIISTINTVLTALFVYSMSLPYAHMVVVLTFLCGLLPIIGNLVSNAVIVGIAFMVSPSFAMAALIFLIVVHKLEYFLNSKIIGSRIRHPMWLILLGLILGEQLMGIPGMILAPVVLNFIKTESMQIPADKNQTGA